MTRMIEFRVVLREEVSDIKNLPDVEEYAETLKNEIYDSDPESAYIADVTYEVKELASEVNVTIVAEDNGTYSAWVEGIPVYAHADTATDAVVKLHEALKAHKELEGN